MIRLGSTTRSKSGIIEINSVESIKISANKRLMKAAFDRAGCSTARWTPATDANDLIRAVEQEEKLRFPIVAKHIYGSRGTGNTLLRSKDDFLGWAYNKKFENYIFENFVSFLLEYRLHVTRDKVFYTCRKALVKTTNSSDRWRRHKDNCVWLLETNPDFHKPNSWNDIVESCIKALNEMGADILSFDIKVQSPLSKGGEEREYQEFILIECNSASSFGNPNGAGPSICSQKYLEIIPALLIEKYERVIEKYERV